MLDRLQRNKDAQRRVEESSEECLPLMVEAELILLEPEFTEDEARDWSDFLTRFDGQELCDAVDAI